MKRLICRLLDHDIIICLGSLLNGDGSEEIVRTHLCQRCSALYVEKLERPEGSTAQFIEEKPCSMTVPRCIGRTRGGACNCDDPESWMP